MLFPYKEFTYFFLCFVQLKVLVAPVYSSCLEQNITYAIPGTIYNGNQLYPQTLYSFSVLESTLLTPKCMGTSFWLLWSGWGSAPLLLAHGPLHPSIISGGWSSLSTLRRSVSTCKWYDPLQCWQGLSSPPFFLSLPFSPFLLSSSCVSFSLRYSAISLPLCLITTITLLFTRQKFSNF